MIGLNYNVEGKGKDSKALVDLTGREAYYPTPDEISVFLQSGGVFVNVDDAMWSATINRCRLRSTPDPVPANAGGQPFDYDKAAEVTLNLLAKRVAS